MAGHSKWANIQHRKKNQDARRSKLFTKLLREVAVAAHACGGDLNTNARLRLAVDKACGSNVPKDTVYRAIKKAAGFDGGNQIEEVRYEGYGPGGVAVMIECMTDNRNRTVADIRYMFSKHGGNLGTEGSVAYLFTAVGQISYPAGIDEEAIIDVAIDAGVDDVITNDDGSVDVLTAVQNFVWARDKLIDIGLVPEQAGVTMRATTNVEVDAAVAPKILRLLDVLDDHDDVQQVYSNANIPEQILDQIT